MTAPTGPPAGHTAQELGDLGLDAADLQSFGTSDSDDVAESPPTPPPVSPAPAAPSTGPAPSPPVPEPAGITPATSEPPLPQAGVVAPQAQPWRAVADGQEILLPGAMLQPDGNVLLPPDAQRVLQHQWLADRRVWQTERAHWQRQQQQLQQQRHESQVRAETVLQAILGAAEQGDEALWGFVQQFKADLPRLQAEAKAKYFEEQLQQTQARLQPIDQAQVWQAMEPQFAQGLTEYVGQYLQRPEYQALVANGQQLLVDLWGMRGDLFRQADARGIPEAGIQPGGWYVDLHRLEHELRREALVAQRLAQATAAKAVLERNAQALQPPPVVPGGGAAKSTPPAGESGLGEPPKTKVEYRERMRRLAESS